MLPRSYDAFKYIRQVILKIESIFKISEKMPYDTCDKLDIPKTIKDKENVVKEGKARIPFLNSNSVFYNPVQEFNRDVSVAVLKQFIPLYKKPQDIHPNSKARKFKKPKEEKITLLEALAASGLRSIRYALEAPGIDHIVANDLNAEAVRFMNINFQQNNVDHIVSPSLSDAALLMYQHRKVLDRFTIVDLDPYGSPAPFLDGAVQCTADGGLLMVTCTDMAILCGNHPETSRAKYGAMSLKTKYCHEMALRIILQSIESNANRYGRYIEPLLSLSVDFYVRVFVRIYTSPKQVKHSTSKLAMVYSCTDCHAFYFQHLGTSSFDPTNKETKFGNATGPPVGTHCSHCGSVHHVGGPIWIAPIHNRDFVASILEDLEQTPPESPLFNTAKRMKGVLTLAYEELEDCPFFYHLDTMASTIHVYTPKLIQFKSAILHAGYRVSDTHVGPNKVKTDAPIEVIWDILRCWVKTTSLKRELEDNTPAKAILSKEPKIQADFTVHEQATAMSKEKKLLRYQPNPEPFWGPKSRAKSKGSSPPPDAKRKLENDEDISKIKALKSESL